MLDRLFGSARVLSSLSSNKSRKGYSTSHLNEERCNGDIRYATSCNWCYTTRLDMPYKDTILSEQATSIGARPLEDTLQLFILLLWIHISQLVCLSLALQSTMIRPQILMMMM